MFGIFLVFALPVLLVPLVVLERGKNSTRLYWLLFAAYATRIFFEVFLSDVPIFSYGAGGDSRAYLLRAQFIVKIWQEHGIHYVTSRECPPLGNASLPTNMFALVSYIGGTEGLRLGSTAIIAALACVTCTNFYQMAVELGTPRSIAFRVLAVILFMPAFFLYTSDTYKEGPVLFFLTTTLWSAMRVSRQFSFRHMLVGIAACLGLYGCRFYLVFVAVTPLVSSIIGFRSKNWSRIVAGVVFVALGFTLVLTSTSVLEHAQKEAELAYFINEHSRSNEEAASGVTFDDDGRPSGALHLKILYTLFSPFPWQTGSVALQLGKIEALVWYYFCYRAFLAARRLRKDDPWLLFTFLAFLIPTTILYALMMTNVGLIVRERMGIVMVGMLLGTLSWAKVTHAGDPILDSDQA